MRAFKKVFNRLNLFDQASTIIRERGVLYWREQIYNSMLSVMVLLGPFAVIPSVILSFANGFYGLGVFDIAAYLVVMALWIVKGVRYEVRAGLFLTLALSVGMIVFVITGNEGAGLFWIFLVPPLASLLLGLRWATTSFAVITGILLLIGVFIDSSLPAFEQVAQSSIESWVVYSVNFLLTNAIITFPLATLLEGLIKSARELEEQASETRRLSQESAQSEERFTKAFQISPIGISILALGNNRYLDANNAWLEIYGFQKREVIGKTPEELYIIDRESREKIAAEFQKRGRLRDVELSVQTRNRGNRDLIVSMEQLTIGGEPCVLATSIDITDSKKLEAEIKTNRERERKIAADYQFLFERNPLPMWVYDLESLRFLAVNESAVESYGYSREEFLAMTIKDIRPAEEVDRLETNLAITTGQVTQASGPWKHVKKDGSVIDAEISSSRFDFRGRAARLVLASDVTERFRSQAKLRESDEILKRVKSLVLVLDSTGNVTYVSPSSEGVLGYSPAELLGEGWWRLTRDNPKDAEGEKQILRRIALGEVPLAAEPYERPIKDRFGAIHWIEWTDSLGPNNTIIGVGHDVTQRKEDTAKIESQLEDLKTLSEIDKAILNSFDLRLNLTTLIRAIVERLSVDAVNIMLYDPSLQTLENVTGYGFRTEHFDRGDIRLGEGLAGKAALERRIVHEPEIRKNKKTGFLDALDGEGFVSYYGIPLIARGEIRGVLEVFQRSPLTGEEDWLGFLKALAGQAAIAIDTIKTFESLQNSNAELILSYDAAIEGWSRALDLRDEETEGHSKRVAQMAVDLARALGMSGRDLVNLSRGSLLHDIGKMGVPDHILNKPGKLTDEEWNVMKQHPVHARKMLQSLTYLESAIDIPYAHHEKWDGSGYPLGLRGEEIPLAARIFAVVDVYDALTSDRPYREAWSEANALDYIQNESGKHFDPEIVEGFLKSLVAATNKDAAKP